MLKLVKSTVFVFALSALFCSGVNAQTANTQPKFIILKIAENNTGQNDDGVWDKTKEISSDVWDGTKEVGSDVWNGAKEVTGDVWDGAKEVGSDVKEGISGNDEKTTDSDNNNHNKK